MLRPPIAGRPLRYLLTVVLAEARRPLSIDELVEAVRRSDLEVAGRPSKTVSDALRWKQRKGRVRRTGHGSYAIGSMPDSTLRWIRMQVRRSLP